MKKIIENIKRLPYNFYFGLGLFIFSFFGVRDVIVPSIIERLIISPALRGLMIPIYWIGLVVGCGILFVYFRCNPIQFYRGVTRKDFFVWTLLATPFLYLTITKRLFLDFWIDEVLSITRHIQPSIQSALFWYPAPNNHIFSNAISGLYTQLIGVTDLLTLLTQPLILRGLYFVIGLFTIVTLTYIAHHFVSPRAGLLTLSLLTTTIPFFNFIVQIRGYAPSLLLASLMLMFSLQYRQRMYRRDALAIGLCAGLLFYTVPSNVYYTIAVALIFGLVGLGEWRQSSKKSFAFGEQNFVMINAPLTITLAAGVGTLVIGLLYLPVLAQVLGNSVVESLGWFQGTALAESLPQILPFFLSGRLIIFILAWLGAVYAVIRRDSQMGEYHLLVVLAFGVFLLPFTFSFIRGDTPPGRTFLVTLPAFILLAALGLEQILVQLEKRSWAISPIATGGLILGMYLAFFGAYADINAEVASTLVAEDITQIEKRHTALWASQFFEHYAVLTPIAAASNAASDDVIFIDEPNTRYAWVLTVYLDALGIPYKQIGNPAQWTGTKAVILLSYPQRSLQTIQDVYPDAACVPISDVSIYRAVECVFE